MAVCFASKFHQIPNALWERLDLFLPIYKRSRQGGRPRLCLRKIACGILYILRTGCQWKAMPNEFGSGSAIHAYFQEWVESGVFEKLWQAALEEYDDLEGIDWKSPLGGEKKREKPDGLRQDRRQAFGADRRPWRAARRGGGWRQCA